MSKETEYNNNMRKQPMNTNEYDIKVIKVVDGDTVDVDIDLGFGVTLTD